MVGTVELLSAEVRESSVLDCGVDVVLLLCTELCDVLRIGVGVVVERGVVEDRDDVLGVGVELVLDVVGVVLVVSGSVLVEDGVFVDSGLGDATALLGRSCFVVGSASVVGSGSVVVSGSGMLKVEVVVIVVVLFNVVSVVVMVVHDCGTTSPLPSCRLTSCPAQVAAHWRTTKAQSLECMIFGVYLKPQEQDKP